MCEKILMLANVQDAERSIKKKIYVIIREYLCIVFNLASAVNIGRAPQLLPNKKISKPRNTSCANNLPCYESNDNSILVATRPTNRVASNASTLTRLLMAFV